MNAPPCVPTERRPILTVKTLKNWVLPPRPKNARRTKNDKGGKEKKAEKMKSVKSSASPPSSGPNADQKPQKRPSLTDGPIASKQSPPLDPKLKPTSSCAAGAKSSPKPALQGTLAAELASNIGLLDRENYQLKIKLLALIHDYKRLKSHLMLCPVDPLLPVPALVDADSPSSTLRKRVFTEVSEPTSDPMNELILDMNHLSYRSPSDLGLFSDQPVAESPEDPAVDVFNYLNLDSDLEAEDDEFASTLLSRLVSPGCSETDGENSLMTSLTRSTTVSTNNSSLMHDRKQLGMFKFYDLPAYSDSEYGFSFEPIDPQDKMLSVIEEDHYNQVADFLEEKLLSNDVEYYVKKEVH